MTENKVIIGNISDEDLNKVLDAVKEMEREELANKTFEELTKDEKIKLALEELAAIVMGGQDGEEYYNSILFIKNALESFKDL
jgi:Ca2+-binding EF-hand superfamily protein